LLDLTQPGVRAAARPAALGLDVERIDPRDEDQGCKTAGQGARQIEMAGTPGAQITAQVEGELEGVHVGVEDRGHRLGREC
jgi:hypothetical protein